MTRTKKVTKTGTLDRLISENLEAAYQEGAKDLIVGQVLEIFPELDPKNLTMLFYSRRAVINKKVEDAKTEAAETVAA